MSCDGNRTKYFQHVVAGAGAGVGVADLEQLYQARRGQPADQHAALTAEAKTRALFLAMQQAGYTPPTHAADGLPRRESQPGYAAVYDLLKQRGWLGSGPGQPALAMATAPQPVAAAAGPVVPDAARDAARAALAACPELIELAADAYTYRQGPHGPRDSEQLVALANAWFNDTSIPFQIRDKAIRFRSYSAHHALAVELATAACEAGGLTRCPHCQRFQSLTLAHVCPRPKPRYDRNGYDAEGYNRAGYNREGFNRNGRDREGYDSAGMKGGYNRHGYDAYGYDRSGLTTAGYTRDGTDASGWTKEGYRPDAQQVLRDRQGYDRDGYDAQGYDRLGYDRAGKDRQGQFHPQWQPDAQGIYGDGLDAWGCGPDGYDAQGRDRYGFDRSGYNASGYDRNGFTKQGLNADGIDRDGYNQAGFKDGPDGVPRNRAGYDAEGFDAQGFSWTGYDQNGLDRQGQPRMTTDRKGNLVEATYNKSGWDKAGYDRWGYHRKTGLTAPDAQGVQRNPWGWIYDGATQECYDPTDPTYRVPHTGDGATYGPGSFFWDRWKKRGVVIKGNDRYGQDPGQPQMRAQAGPPITPHADMPYADYRRAQGNVTGHPYHVQQTDERAKTQYQQIQHPTPEQRWATARARFDATACRNGVLLRCPHCGQFTNGTDHGCPSFPAHATGVRTFVSGLVLSQNALVVVPGKPDYDPTYQWGGYDQHGFDADGYDRQGYNRAGQDRQGYTREGYDVFGYDRQGFDRDGYNRQGLDRDGTPKPKTIAEAARHLDDDASPVDNKHLADLYSRLCSGLVGQPRRVILRPGALHVNPATGEQRYLTSGFATDMRGKITADPTPLGPNADPRDNLIVTRAGLYHEIGHEQFTPPELWAAVLDAHKSDTPVDFETSTGGTLTLDAGRRFLPQIYNIVEDGRMEREVARTYGGAGEILAASCRLEDRWQWQPGEQRDDYGDLTGALLYEALPYYRVRPEVVEERLSPRARRLFEELRPVVRQAVRGSPDDAFTAAVIIARRLEEEGIVDHDEAKRRGMTPPPPPPPGTKARRPKITIDGDQVIDASQMGGGGGGGPEVDVEFTGHVTIKNADALDGQQGGGQATFSGGVTYEGGQPKGGQQQGNQQGNQQGGQQSGQQGGQQGGQSGGQAGGQSGEQSGGSSGGSSGGQQSGQPGSDPSGQAGGGRGQGSQEADDATGGRRRGSGAAEDDAPTGRRPAAAEEEAGGGGGRKAEDNETGAGRGGGSAGDDAPTGRRPAATDDDGAGGGGGRTAEDDEPGTGRGPGGADDDAAAPAPGTPEDPAGGSSGARADGEDTGTGRGRGGPGDDDDDDGDPWADGDPYVGDVDGDDGFFSDDGGTVSGSTGPAGRGGRASFQGGSGQLRDWDSPFTEAQIADAVADVEAAAAHAIEEGVRAAATPDALGRDLHRPMDDRAATRQRYTTPDGRVETVQVATPKSGNGSLNESLERRRPRHREIARDLARQLKAIREQTDQRLRYQKEGRIDRRRFVAAVKGAEDVKTRIKELPATAFAASVAVDLSGSMATLIGNASLFDATMILSDTFDDLEIAHEVRGFGSDAAQFKSMGDQRFDPERAAVLAAGNRGGTQMAGTAGLATQALRAREEGNKLFVALSDGSLGDHQEAVAILKDARRNGVVTFGIFLGGNAPTKQMDELYGPGNWVQINDIKDFPVSVGRRISQIFKQLR